MWLHHRDQRRCRRSHPMPTAPKFRHHLHVRCRLSRRRFATPSRSAMERNIMARRHPVSSDQPTRPSMPSPIRHRSRGSTSRMEERSSRCSCPAAKWHRSRCARKTRRRRRNNSSVRSVPSTIITDTGNDHLLQSAVVQQRYPWHPPPPRRLRLHQMRRSNVLPAAMRKTSSTHTCRGRRQPLEGHFRTRQ